MADTGARAGAEPLTVSIARFADAIGTLNPRRSGRIQQIGDLKEVQAFAAIPGIPDGQDWLDGVCNICRQPIQVRRVVMVVCPESVACEGCIKVKVDEERLRHHQRYWEHVCPEQFRSTDLKHKDFPADLYAEAKKKDPKRSLFFYGPTGTAKTMVAMLMLKRALLRDQRVGVLWPEKLGTLRSNFDTATFDRYAAFDYLLMDDVLLSAAREPKLVDAVKQLIDIRMRHGRPFIITSQIGSEVDLKEGKEFGDAKAADIERIKALLRRLNDTCDVVNFAKKEGAF